MLTFGTNASRFDIGGIHCCCCIALVAGDESALIGVTKRQPGAALGDVDDASAPPLPAHALIHYIHAN